MLASTRIAIVAPVVDRFDVVIIAASWSSYAFVSEDFLPTVLETARGLASAGKLVVLIGKAPEIDGYDRRCREKALSYPLLAVPVRRSHPSANQRSQRENARVRTDDAERPLLDAVEYL